MSAFAEKPVSQWLDDGRRLSLRHGPIDLIVEAAGVTPQETEKAYGAAVRVFSDILPSLCDELPLLRRQVAPNGDVPTSTVGRAMDRAARCFSSNHFVTPMIAVAGSVADFVLDAMQTQASLTKAYVNNGGDIALLLAPGEQFSIGLCQRMHPTPVMRAHRIAWSDGVGGIATSGWSGRSHSLGIADAVTVFAADAAAADAAATLMANAVDLPGSAKVRRVPACDLSPDSDLGDRLVTVEVLPLTQAEKETAFENGLALARQMVIDGRILSSHLSLQGVTGYASPLARGKQSEKARQGHNHIEKQGEAHA